MKFCKKIVSNKYKHILYRIFSFCSRTNTYCDEKNIIYYLIRFHIKVELEKGNERIKRGR